MTGLGDGAQLVGRASRASTFAGSRRLVGRASPSLLEGTLLGETAMIFSKRRAFSAQFSLLVGLGLAAVSTACGSDGSVEEPGARRAPQDRQGPVLVGRARGSSGGGGSRAGAGGSAGSFGAGTGGTSAGAAGELWIRRSAQAAQEPAGAAEPATSPRRARRARPVTIRWKIWIAASWQ